MKLSTQSTLGAFAVLSASITAPAAAKTIIATPATLSAAFAHARSGDTLQLVGTFAKVRLQYRSFSKPLNLDASRATFTDTVVLKDITNVKLSQGNFNIIGGSTYNSAIAVWGGRNVTVDRPDVIGMGTEIGIAFNSTMNSTVTNGHFDGLHVAVGFGGVRGGTIVGNTIIHAAADGIDIGNSHNINATLNNCSLGNPGVGVHPDCIQLWSTRGKPVQSDNVVSRNTATGPTQGFTSFSAGGGALRVSITRNTVKSSFPQGIACYDCYYSNISFNSVSTLAGATHLTNVNVVGGSNNIIKGNVVNPWPSTARATFDEYGFTADGRFVVNNSYRSEVVSAVPEPACWEMLLIGFAATGLAKRRRVATSTIATVV